MRWTTGQVLVGVALPVLLAATGSTTSTASLAARSPRQVIDVAGLAGGPPPRVDYLADGVLHRRGRTVPTDLPADALHPEILGAVGGRVVLTAFRVGVPDPGAWLFAVDRSGHTERLGGSYFVSDYEPRLVRPTGHIWVYYSDRGSLQLRIWVIDARTGRQVAVYRNQEEPHGLAPADQALYDAWTSRRAPVPDTFAVSPDRSLQASTRPVRFGNGTFGDTVTVREAADRAVVGRFTFADSTTSAVERVLFEDDRRVLVLITASVGGPYGAVQVVVRCGLGTGTCRRATSIGGNIALGVSHPAFWSRGGG